MKKIGLVLSEIFKGSGHSLIRQVERGSTIEDSNFKPDNSFLILSKSPGTHGDQLETSKACRGDVSERGHLNVGYC